MSKPILYDFFATWCGPCRLQSPIVDSISQKHGDIIDVKKIDVEQQPDLANKYQISVVPTLIIEKNGKIIHRIEGVTEEQKLEMLIKDIN